MLPRLRRRNEPPRERPRSTTSIGAAAERQARRFYRLRGYRILAANARSGRYEVDLVLRRGRQLVFCEVKAKGGPRFGDPLEMVDREKQRRIRRAAETWLASHPEAGGLQIRFDVVAVRARQVQRLTDAF